MNEKSTVLELDASIDNLMPVRTAVTAFALEAGYSDHQVLRIELVIEEAFLNVVHHAYHDQGGKVAIHYELTADSHLQVTIIDHAAPFFAGPDALLPPEGSIDERQPGGCGLTIIRSMTRSAIWQRDDDRNSLLMVFDPPDSGN